MKTFKVIFAHNEIVVCLESSAKIPGEQDLFFEHNNNGQAIHALIKAIDISDACNKANTLLLPLINKGGAA